MAPKQQHVTGTKQLPLLIPTVIQPLWHLTTPLTRILRLFLANRSFESKEKPFHRLLLCKITWAPPCVYKNVHITYKLVTHMLHLKGSPLYQCHTLISDLNEQV